jgi:hypothetical protein
LSWQLADAGHATADVYAADETVAAELAAVGFSAKTR